MSHNGFSSAMGDIKESKNGVHIFQKYIYLEQ